MLTALHALLTQLAEKAINREAQIAYAIRRAGDIVGCVFAFNSEQTLGGPVYVTIIAEGKITPRAMIA
jgi:hypothetical protein